MFFDTGNQTYIFIKQVSSTGDKQVTFAVLIPVTLLPETQFYCPGTL